MDFTCLHNCKHEVWLNRQLPDSSPDCFSHLSELHTFLSFTIVAHSSLPLTVEWGMEVIVSSPFSAVGLSGLSAHWNVCLYLYHSIGWGKTVSYSLTYKMLRDERVPLSFALMKWIWELKTQEGSTCVQAPTQAVWRETLRRQDVVTVLLNNGRLPQSICPFPHLHY